MREYRYYTNILWGNDYNPETKAHHIKATDYDDLRKRIPSGVSASSVQVKTGGGWQWVTETPSLIGGIAKYWPEEK